jgi:hypothetical protein
MKRVILCVCNDEELLRTVAPFPPTTDTIPSPYSYLMPPGSKQGSYNLALFCFTLSVEPRNDLEITAKT